MKLRSSLTRSLLVFFALMASAWSQEFRAMLTGKVTDASGAPIPHATVRAIKKNTNQRQETKTGADGLYLIPFLDPGDYDVQATASGFQTTNHQNITLEVSQSLNLPIQLTVGQLTQEVIVSGEQELIQTTDSSNGLVFDPVKTQDLPLSGRRATCFSP